MAKKKEKIEKYSEEIHYVFDKTDHEHLIEYVIKVTETDRGNLVEMSLADNGTWSVPGEIVASALDTGDGIEWLKHPNPKNQDYLEAYQMEIMYKFLGSLNCNPAEFIIRKI